MANSPIVVGQTSPIFSWTWQDDKGKAIDVTGATITVTWIKQPDGSSRLGDGVHTIVNGPLGQTTYAQSATDVATPGTYIYRFKAVLTGGGVLFADKQELVIESA